MRPTMTKGNSNLCGLCTSFNNRVYCRDLESSVPPHFYGELAKTDLGCQVLQEKGHFAEFAHFIRQHALESDDLEIIFRLKSVLWAVVSLQRAVMFDT